MTNKSVKITVVSIGIVIFVLLLNMRTIPEVKSNLDKGKGNQANMLVDLVAINETLDKMSTKEEMLAKSRSLMSEGNPMEGVFMMREIAVRYPNYIEAIYYLGEASISTGQFEKAVDRFTKIIEIAGDTLYNGYVEGAYVNLQNAYFQLSQYDKQVDVLKGWRMKTPEEDTALIRQIDLRIQELNNIQIK